ncbi:hypothetical protein RJT34_06674 [Clitoria ternatea]|uniref:Uncharacterized protein n=1 Tax=Clitoria ternatea TaxID=43366 RepID=A0AAN9K2J0_CLITE
MILLLRWNNEFQLWHSDSKRNGMDKKKGEVENEENVGKDQIQSPKQRVIGVLYKKRPFAFFLASIYHSIHGFIIVEGEFMLFHVEGWV